MALAQCELSVPESWCSWTELWGRPHSGLLVTISSQLHHWHLGVRWQWLPGLGVGLWENKTPLMLP